MLQDVALKLRNAMRQRVSPWGPSVSLHRQFEASDPDRKGYISLKSFLMVLEHLGVQLIPVEVGIINRRFDRHGNDTIDYLDFCRFVSIDAREMEIVSNKLASKFAELRRRGVSATATFDVYDIGRTGFVSRRDFRECSRQLQLPITENQLEALMGRFAHQGNGDLVSWQEFITFVNASGVNLPLDEMEGPVMGDGYDGMDVWYDRGGEGVNGGADRAGGTPKRGGGGSDFRDMYRSMGRKGDDYARDDGWEGGGGDGGSGSMWVDHSSNAKDRTFTMDMKESRKVGREAVSYLDNHGVTTPKWIRSVLKVGQGKEGFDEDGGDDSDDDFGFGKRISRSPLKGGRRSATRKAGISTGRRRRRKGRYDSDEDDSDWSV
jgi:Ca2+-binding EF-hand superfamily protein